MCGIIGYVGKNNAIPRIINGLKSLEYRGYDSAGIAYSLNNKIKIVKEKGKIINLEAKINKDDISHLGIGHTRWATHGIPNKINAHPHNQKNITLVHNGIIENYEELKKELEKSNYTFKSDTDTEIAAGYINYLYEKEKDILKVLNKLKTTFRGSYAFGIIVNGDDNLYAIRHDSPLIVGLGIEENFIASDVPAILEYTNKYLLLENDEVVKINKNNIKIYKDLKEIKKKINEFNFNVDQAQKAGYDHFMLKEINEQDTVIKNTLSPYIENGKESIISNLPDFSKYNKIDIVGCGSAYHTGIIGKYLIEEYGNIPVNVEIASEYRYKKLFLDKKTLVIVISQSGETADTLASLRIAKEHGCDTIGIVNVVGSSIAREVDHVIYINAGCEIAVATTKAYSLQLLILSLIAFKLGIQKNTISDNEINKILKDYKELPDKLRNEINKNYKDLAKQIYKKEDIFFIGRNIDYATALEGSLKLKEISYIHSETYAAGELKHGTISLIAPKTPVIAIVTEKKIAEKTISNIKEVKARGAYVVLITTNKLDSESDYYDKKVVLQDTNKLIQPIINVIPLQLLSYEVAKLRNCDIDKPRNLAKSVTVE